MGGKLFFFLPTFVQKFFMNDSSCLITQSTNLWADNKKLKPRENAPLPPISILIVVFHGCIYVYVKTVNWTLTFVQLTVCQWYTNKAVKKKEKKRMLDGSRVWFPCPQDSATNQTLAKASPLWTFLKTFCKLFPKDLNFMVKDSNPSQFGLTLKGVYARQ